MREIFIHPAPPYKNMFKLEPKHHNAQYFKISGCAEG